jgi:hypothetical protein
VLRDIAHDDPAYAGPRIDRVENIAAAIDLVRQLIMLEAARHIPRRRASRAVLQAITDAVAEQR